MARTIGDVLNEARTILQDKKGSEPRYTNDELLEAFNGFMTEVRAKRPDLFLLIGLRTAVPNYTTSQLGVAFPLDLIAYDAFVYYIVGRCEAREDTFTEDSRAVTFMNKAISQLMQVAS
jgi:hypothetical protein